MKDLLSRILDFFSTFFAQRKGLLPLIGIALVIVNFGIKMLGTGWLSSSDLFLHLGVVLAIFGIILAWAL